MAKSKGRVKEQLTEVFKYEREKAAALIRIRLPESFSVTKDLTSLNQFDKGIAIVTQSRGATYDHPKRNFRRIALLCAVVDECEDPEAKIALRAICTKIARLIHSPRHTDSWIDIAGYARTGVMLYSK